MNSRKKLQLKQIIRLCLVLVSIAILSLVVGVFWQIHKWRPQISTVETAQGNQAKVFSQQVSKGEHLPVSLKEVPEVLKQATVTVEDQNFYQRPSLTWGQFSLAFLRAILRTNPASLDGTILVQQLARQYPTPESRSQNHLSLAVGRLIRTMFFENEFTKDEQLELYFNESWYGQDIHGIGQATKVYFNKSVNQLTLAESIVLAGLPQRPTHYDLRRGETNPEDQDILWLDRARHVGNLMREQGTIDADTWHQAYDDILALHDQRLPDYQNWPIYNSQTFTLRYPQSLNLYSESKNKVVFIQPNTDPSQWCDGQPNCLKVTVGVINSPTLETFVRHDAEFVRRVFLSEQEREKMDEHRDCHCYTKTTMQVRGETMEMAVYGAGLNSNPATKARIVLFSSSTHRGYDFFIEGISEDAFLLFDFGPMLNSIKFIEK